MIEDLALKFVFLPEGGIRAIGWLIWIMGGIASGVTSSSKTKLERAPYFAYTALVIFLASVIQVVWLLTSPAMANGFIWALVAVSLASSLIGGFFYGKLAIARSRDAFGHGNYAILAFIPFANFVLLLKHSKNTIDADRPPQIRLMRGVLGVVFGFVMFSLATATSKIIEEATTFLVAQDRSSQGKSVEFMVRSNGVEQTLRFMADNAQLPSTVDEITTLSRIEVTGNQLRRTFVVSRSNVAFTGDFRTRVVNAVCAHGPFIILLRAGASIREVYVQRDGTQIGSVLISPDVCGL